MSVKQGCWLALLSGLVLTMAACKKKTAEPPQPTQAVSPNDPNQPEEPDEDDPNAYGASTGPEPSGWAHEEPDLGAFDAAVRKPTVKKEVASDADIAAAKEDEEKMATEKAVEASVNGALGRVKSCFNRHKAAAGQYTLSVRVHRSGRVLSSNVSGLSGEANRCVERALSNLRVKGVLTDTFTFKRPLKNW
jgi:hypothetical protein